MVVWTISAQEGTGGARVAADLAAAAEVSLLDRETLALLAHQADPTLPELDDLDGRLGSRFSKLLLSTAISAGSADALHEVELRQKLPTLARAVVSEAARSPCVIYAPAAFAAVPQHPSAIHVRLRAPLEWRIAAYQREQLVDRQCAEKKLKQVDHRTHVWVRSLYRVDIDDPRRFSVVLDASRFSPERLVEIMLSAAGARDVRAASRSAARTPFGQSDRSVAPSRGSP
jgi:hypothetical protein